MKFSAHSGEPYNHPTYFFNHSPQYSTLGSPVILLRIPDDLCHQPAEHLVQARPSLLMMGWLFLNFLPACCPQVLFLY